jgi:hypothetical protein
LEKVFVMHYISKPSLLCTALGHFAAKAMENHFWAGSVQARPLRLKINFRILRVRSLKIFSANIFPATRLDISASVG